jgi:hypothetical protein
LVWTGARVDLSQYDRLPREERMKGFAAVEFCANDRPFDLFPDATPVCIELLDSAECLTTFTHPTNPVYVVFGPEDGSVPPVIRRHCHMFVLSDVAWWRHSERAAPLATCFALGQRVLPAEPRKASVVAVGCVQHSSMLDRERRNLRITHQWAGGASLQDHLPQHGPVLIRRRKYLYIRLLQPPIYDLHGLLQGDTHSR